MSSGGDPGFWREIASWLWAVLMLPIAVVFRKADAAVPKDEFHRHVDKMDRSIENLNRTHERLFDKIDELKNLIIEKKE